MIYNIQPTTIDGASFNKAFVQYTFVKQALDIMYEVILHTDGQLEQIKYTGLVTEKGLTEDQIVVAILSNHNITLA